MEGRGAYKQVDGREKEYSFKDDRLYNFVDDINKYILKEHQQREADESKYITILINLHGADLINSICTLHPKHHVRCISPVSCGLPNLSNRGSLINAFQIAYNVSHLDHNSNASTYEKMKKIIQVFNENNPDFYDTNSFHRPIIDHCYLSKSDDDVKEIFMIDTNHKTDICKDSYNLFNKKIKALETIQDIKQYNILPMLLPFLTMKNDWFFRSDLINVLLDRGYDTINIIDFSCRSAIDYILEKNHTLGKQLVCDYKENKDDTTFFGDDVTSVNE